MSRSHIPQFHLETDSMNINFTIAPGEFQYDTITLETPSTIGGRDFSGSTFDLHRDYQISPSHIDHLMRFKTGSVTTVNRKKIKLCKTISKGLGEDTFTLPEGGGVALADIDPSDGSNSYLVRILNEGHYLLLELKRNDSGNFDAIFYNSLPYKNYPTLTTEIQKLLDRRIAIYTSKSIVPKYQVALESDGSYLPTNDCALYMCDFANRILQGEVLKEDKLAPSEELINKFKFERRVELAMRIGLIESQKKDDEIFGFDEENMAFSNGFGEEYMVLKSMEFVENIKEKLRDPIVTRQAPATYTTGAAGAGHGGGGPITSEPEADPLFSRISYTKVPGAAQIGSQILFTPAGKNDKDDYFSLNAETVRDTCGNDDATASSIANSLIAGSIKSAHNKSNIKFSDNEIAVIILIARKFNGISSLVDGKLEECLKAAFDATGTDERIINPPYLKAIRLFSKNFQESNHAQGVHTGNADAIRAGNIVGMRLKRLTVDHAQEFLDQRINIQTVRNMIGNIRNDSPRVAVSGATARGAADSSLTLG